MRDGALARRPDGLGVFPDRARVVPRRAWLPLRPPLGQHRVVKPDRNRSGLGIDVDDVAIVDQTDRPALGGLGSDMTDAESPRSAREAAIGNERDLVARTLAIEHGRGRQHFPHAGAAARTLVSDDQNITLLVVPGRNRLKAFLFRIEAAGRTGKLERVEADHLHNGSVRCQIAAQPDHNRQSARWASRPDE